ncbi:hypothetical protein [Methylobacterium sp.]|uniref:hypothetical protein n=1 Tax=Methylobacterium sp. TaxID=409 RepID=UPI0015CEEBC7|nr:hypothetical protein [Methylobacterium sp.]
MSSATKAPGAEGPGDWVLVPRLLSERMRKTLHGSVVIRCRLDKREASIMNDQAWWEAVLATVPVPAPGANDAAELARLAELSNFATPGVWYTVDTPWGDGTWLVAGNPDPHAGTMVCDCQDVNETRPEDGPDAADDAAFIAASVNYVRKLIRSGQLVASTPGQKGAGCGWQPISEAPLDTEVEVRVGRMTFLAKLVPGAAMDTNEHVCDQWIAAREGEHPPCWSDGCCWAVNENEDRSLWPEAWRPAPPTPETKKEADASSDEQRRAGFKDGLAGYLKAHWAAAYEEGYGLGEQARSGKPVALGTEARSDETVGLGPKDDGPADVSATPAQTPPSPPSATPEGDPPMTVEEARAFLVLVDQAQGVDPGFYATLLRNRAVSPEAYPHVAKEMLAQASRIELALRTLHAAGEVR